MFDRGLSQLQRDLLAKVRAAGGRIERRPGGYWTSPGVPSVVAWHVAPRWWYTTGTIEALASLGFLKPTRREGMDGSSLVVEYEVVPLREEKPDANSS